MFRCRGSACAGRGPAPSVGDSRALPSFAAGVRGAGNASAVCRRWPPVSAPAPQLLVATLLVLLVGTARCILREAIGPVPSGAACKSLTWVVSYHQLLHAAQEMQRRATTGLLPWGVRLDSHWICAPGSGLASAWSGWLPLTALLRIGPHGSLCFEPSSATAMTAARPAQPNTTAGRALQCGQLVPAMTRPPAPPTAPAQLPSALCGLHLRSVGGAGTGLPLLNVRGRAAQDQGHCVELDRCPGWDCATLKRAAAVERCKTCCCDPAHNRSLCLRQVHCGGGAGPRSRARGGRHAAAPIRLPAAAAATRAGGTAQ